MGGKEIFQKRQDGANDHTNKTIPLLVDAFHT